MKIPKLIQKAADLFDKEAGNTKIEVITFRHAAAGVKCKRKGFEITFVDSISRSRFVITFEPIKRRFDKDRWLISGSYCKYFLNTNLFYAVNLTQAYKKLNKEIKY